MFYINCLIEVHNHVACQQSDSSELNQFLWINLKHNFIIQELIKFRRNRLLTGYMILDFNETINLKHYFIF